MYRKSVWGMCPVFPSHLPIPCAFCCEAATHLGSVWSHMISYLLCSQTLDVLLAFCPCLLRLQGRSLTVFMLIFFLLCRLLFFCDALQEIWNGIITPPVEVANRDHFLHLYFCTFISLFSQVFVCSAQTGWVVENERNFETLKIWFYLHWLILVHFSPEGFGEMKDIIMYNINMDLWYWYSHYHYLFVF